MKSKEASMTETGDRLDPLRALVVDAQRFNREKLAEVLKGRVWLDLQTASVHLAPEARPSLSSVKAVLLALLGQKALSLLDEKLSEAMSPKVLEEVTGLVGNTVRPVLKKLREEGLVVRREQGYAIHNPALHLVVGAITNP